MKNAFSKIFRPWVLVLILYMAVFAVGCLPTQVWHHQHLTPYRQIMQGALSVCALTFVVLPASAGIAFFTGKRTRALCIVLVTVTIVSLALFVVLLAGFGSAHRFATQFGDLYLVPTLYRAYVGLSLLPLVAAISSMIAIYFLSRDRRGNRIA